MQFVVVKFRAHERRTYTYHNEGPPVAVGDTVKVASARADEGWSAVPVVAVTDEKPAFHTKPILGVVEVPAPKLDL